MKSKRKVETEDLVLDFFLGNLYFPQIQNIARKYRNSC